MLFQSAKSVVNFLPHVVWRSSLLEILMSGESSADTKLEGLCVKSLDSGQTKAIRDSEFVISTPVDQFP